LISTLLGDAKFGKGGKKPVIRGRSIAVTQGEGIGMSVYSEMQRSRAGTARGKGIGREEEYRASMRILCSRGRKKRLITTKKKISEGGGKKTKWGKRGKNKSEEKDFLKRLGEGEVPR